MGYGAHTASRMVSGGYGTIGVVIGVIMIVVIVIVMINKSRS